MSRAQHFATLFIGWVLGIFTSYILTASLAPSNGNILHLSLISFSIAVVAGTAGYFCVQDVWAAFTLKQWKDNWAFLLALAVLLRFAYRVAEVGFSFQNLLPSDKFLLPRGLTAPFWIACILALGLLPFLIRRDSQSFPFLQRNARGLVLAVLFFFVYFVLANVFNRQDFNNNNVFFAADTNQWHLRLASPEGYSMEMRAIHPLAFLLLRPIIFLISFVLGADLFRSILLLLALIGSADVFLVWILLLRAAKDKNLAFLFSMLFGMTSAQLMFAPVIESYAFSGFFLILFFVLLTGRTSLVWLIVSGVTVFGVTISNLVQAGLGLLIIDARIKRTFLFGLFVIAVSAGLSLPNKMIYPASGLFFKPADYGVESQHFVDPTNVTSMLNRARLVGSDIFLFSVVAPQPFARTYHRDEREDFPKFNFMQGERLSRFTGLGKFAVWVWIGILIVGAVFLARSLIREGFTESNRLPVAFLGCLVFNFVFHLFYGFEPFLYATDWIYALIFFAALSLRPFAGNKAFHAVMLILLVLISLNNLSFIHFLMSEFSLFIPGAGS